MMKCMLYIFVSSLLIYTTPFYLLVGGVEPYFRLLPLDIDIHLPFAIESIINCYVQLSMCYIVRVSFEIT